MKPPHKKSCTFELIVKTKHMATLLKPVSQALPTHQHIYHRVLYKHNYNYLLYSLIVGAREASSYPLPLVALGKDMRATYPT